MFDPSAIKQLTQMLNPEKDEDSDSDIDAEPGGKLGPGHIGPPREVNTTNAKANTKLDEKDIWNADEVQEGSEFVDLLDPRPQPEYEITYKQSVSSEDIFLQLGNKTPATSSCEDMIVSIKLPGTKNSEIELDVKEKFLDCRTPKLKLGLHLPHPVNSKTGKAEWDGKTSTLRVTLRMNREYDFVNF